MYKINNDHNLTSGELIFENNSTLLPPLNKEASKANPVTPPNVKDLDKQMKSHDRSIKSKRHSHINTASYENDDKFDK